MRCVKLFSWFVILVLLFNAFPATVAEDVTLDLELNGEEDLDIELDGVPFATPDELIDLDLSDLDMGDAGLELDGLQNDPMEPVVEEQIAIPAVSNVDGDFEIDENGRLWKYNGNDTRIVIPNGVDFIDSTAFSNNTVIESVTIPDGVTKINGQAFNGCTSLTRISIPDSVTWIGWYAFRDCTSLTDVRLSSNLSELAGHLFDNCKSLEKVNVPNGVETIHPYAFGWCYQLKDVSLPDSVITIDEGAFYNCNALKSLTIPSGVTSIGLNAFSYCYNLADIVIPASVTSIGPDAFTNCENCVIQGEAGSYTDRYSLDAGIPFNAPIVSFDEKTVRFMDESAPYDAVFLYANQSHALNAIQRPSEFATSLIWSSSDTNVVTVDQNGVITGIAPGKATVTAATEDGRGKAGQIRIVVPEPVTIQITETYGTEIKEKKIPLDQTVTIVARPLIWVIDESGTDLPVSWATSDSSIVSIEDSKKESSRIYSVTLKGNKLGKAIVTATTPDGGRTDIPVEVRMPAPSSVTIDKSVLQLYVGDKHALTVTIYPENAVTTLKWGSEDPSIATISDTGVVEAISEGYTAVYVQTDNWMGDRIEVYVGLLPPTSIELDDVALGLGETLSLNPTLLPEGSTSILTWSSSKPEIASIDQNGIVSANKTGSARITATASNGVKTTVSVIVKALPSRVKLNKAKATLSIGDTLNLKTSFTPADTYSTMYWTSSAPKIANVDKGGQVTALKAGKATITVLTDNGKSAKAVITVKPAPKKVKLNKRKVTLAVKDTLTLKAALTPSNAYTTLKWKSSKPSVASVNSKGVVKAKKAGTAVISVTTKNGRTATATITVKPAPKKIVLNKTKVTLTVGRKLKLKPTLKPTGAYTTLTWKSSKPAVASVTQKGMVTAKKAGKAVITVTTKNGKKAKVSITVKKK